MDTIITKGWDDYALMDTGHGRKLERFGPYLIDRPEEQAMWQPQKPELWDKADAIFTGDDDRDEGRWRYQSDVEEQWQTGYGAVKFYGQFTNFRHVGFFPEQSPHWDDMAGRIGRQISPRILNLFGYTGVASLIAAKAGAKVTHVDASKKAVQMAKDNQDLSDMLDAPIRWIVEDARKFVAREIRRGNTYTGILIDPPKFGRGAEGEVWNLFDDLPDMLDLCRQVMDANAFLILTSYAIRASSYAIDELCRDIFKNANIQSGELVIAEKDTDRKLSTSLYSKVSLE